MTTSVRPSPQGRFEELTPTECLTLIGAKKVGRVAMCTPGGPQVFPVNYTMDDGGVVFRTAPTSQLARHLKGGRAAFEVDDIDDYLECGWSVLVVGDACHVEVGPQDLPDDEGRPTPWASGSRPLFIRINPIGITGRRVHPS